MAIYTHICVQILCQTIIILIKNVLNFKFLSKKKLL